MWGNQCMNQGTVVELGNMENEESIWDKFQEPWCCLGYFPNFWMFPELTGEIISPQEIRVLD